MRGMMRNLIRAWVVAVLGLVAAAPAGAAQLRVEPLTVEVVAPGAAATLTLRNDSATEANVQIRVFRWSQSEGREILEPTTDVVASPPAVKMSPGRDYVARLVRVAKRPVVGEEAYRIFVDQLPEPVQGRLSTVNLLIRYSIPAFFIEQPGTAPAVKWSVALDQGRIMFAAQNLGYRRLRLSSVRLRDASGATISFGNGLLGYVLAQSTMSWTASGPPRAFGNAVSISAESDQGPIHAEVSGPAR